MGIINNVNQEQAVILATKVNNYRAAIFCSTIEQVHEAIFNLRKILNKKNVAYLAHWRSDRDCELQFPNGSIILVRIPDESIRGYRFDYIFFDEDIDQRG